MGNESAVIVREGRAGRGREADVCGGAVLTVLPVACGAAAGWDVREGREGGFGDGIAGLGGPSLATGGAPPSVKEGFDVKAGGFGTGGGGGAFFKIRSAGGLSTGLVAPLPPPALSNMLALDLTDDTSAADAEVGLGSETLMLGMVTEAFEKRAANSAIGTFPEPVSVPDPESATVNKDPSVAPRFKLAEDEVGAPSPLSGRPFREGEETDRVF